MTFLSLKFIRKLENITQKKGCGRKRKIAASEDAKTVKEAKWQHTATTQREVEIKNKFSCQLPAFFRSISMV